MRCTGVAASGLLLLGCASSPAPSTLDVRQSEQRASVRQPRYTRAALPGHTPSPTDSMPAGSAGAVAVRGDQSQARRLVTTMLQALVEGDRPALERCFAEPLLQVRYRRSVARQDVLKACLSLSEELQNRPELKLEDLVDLDAMAFAEPTTRNPGPAVDADVSVRLPLIRSADRRLSRKLSRNPCTSKLFLRLGPNPRIVAVSR